MKIHEYQARALLRQAALPVPTDTVIDNADEAVDAFQRLAAPQVVVKAQVHAGGRGKAGYVTLVRTAEQAEQDCRRMFSKPMVSAQTHPQGIKVGKILLAAAVDIEKEYYLGIVVDRARNRPVMMASAEGGVEIEQVARDKPEAIHKAWLHPHLGLQSFQARQLALAIGMRGDQLKQTVPIMTRLAKLFLEKDCSLAEINPLVCAPDGKVWAIDAKFNFDDNALFAHKDLQEMFDPAEEDANELRAKQFDLSYISLDGNIGCLVNGAGLAMATMDIIKLHGGEPANFLDVGGSVTAEGAIEAFRIILADPKVKGVLVNIFGGIAKCDTIAEALISAGTQVGFNVPVVVRLEGTNVEKARKMLAEAATDLPTLQTAADLTDAARKVCQAV